MNRQLPATAVEVLAGHHQAEQISGHLNAAYWLHGRDDATALFLLEKAHDEFAALADALGYVIAPKPAPDAPALRAEWHGICEDMNTGRWGGTEAEALARIEAIKAELASAEAA
jgi:hypothetical protein